MVLITVMFDHTLVCPRKNRLDVKILKHVIYMNLDLSVRIDIILTFIKKKKYINIVLIVNFYILIEPKVTLTFFRLTISRSAEGHS